MSDDPNTNWTPKPGDTVYARLTVDMYDGDREGNVPWWCFDASGKKRAFNAADLIPAPPPREPWDVLREAAAICREHKWHNTAADSLSLATHLEVEARDPRPRLAALAQDGSVDVERVRRALAVLEGRE